MGARLAEPTLKQTPLVGPAWKQTHGTKADPKSSAEEQGATGHRHGGHGLRDTATHGDRREPAVAGRTFLRSLGSPPCCPDLGPQNRGWRVSCLWSVAMPWEAAQAHWTRLGREPGCWGQGQLRGQCTVGFRFRKGPGQAAPEGQEVGRGSRGEEAGACRGADEHGLKWTVCGCTGR